METITTGNLDVGAVDNDSSSTSVASRVVSPPGVPGDVLDEQHVDISRALFRNDDAAIRDNIPSQHLCPMVQEPPFVAVYFELPNTDGTTTTPSSQQVYERSALYRFVGAQHEFPSDAQFTLFHPFTRVPILRNRDDRQLLGLIREPTLFNYKQRREYLMLETRVCGV